MDLLINNVEKGLCPTSEGNSVSIPERLSWKRSTKLHPFLLSMRLHDRVIVRTQIGNSDNSLHKATVTIDKSMGELPR